MAAEVLTFKPKLRGITMGQLWEKQFPPREFILGPWLRNGETCLLWAETGVGKTWLTMSIALAIAGGGKVGPWEAPKPRKVFVVDGEMNEQDLQERALALVDTGAIRDADRDAIGRNFHLMARQSQSPHSTFYDVTDPEGQRLLLKHMDEVGAEVLVIDNLTTCADGLPDENDAVAFRSVMAFMLMMKQAGKTAILVHHANKSGDNYRGSSALAATFEVILGLKRPDIARTDSACFVTNFGKLRAKQDDSVSRPHTWTLGAIGWDIQEDAQASEWRVLKALQSLEYVSQNEIAEALGLSKGQVSKSVQKLIAKGEIKGGRLAIDEMFTNAAELRREGATDGGPYGDPDADF